MNLSRIPSLALLLLGTTLAFAPTLQAGASNKNGNPFGNGTFFQTTGTFSAVVRGENLSGTMLFSTGVSTNTANANSSGTTTISYLGSDGARAGMYIGNAVGMWDPSSGAISGQLWGGLALSGVSNTTVWPEIYNNSNSPTWPGLTNPTAPSFPVAISTESNTVVTITSTNALGETISYATNILSTNTIYVMPYGNNSFNDTAYMSGNFSGSTQNKYPNQTFTAQGTLVQQQILPQVADTGMGTIPVQMAPDLQIPITVQGIRVSDSYSAFNTISNSVPYDMTIYSITNFNTF